MLRTGGNTPLCLWSWKLFAHKGQRNIAVAAAARKLLVQGWSALMGNTPDTLETNKSFATKLRDTTVTPGKALLAELKIPRNLDACVLHLQRLILCPAKIGIA